MIDLRSLARKPEYLAAAALAVLAVGIAGVSQAGGGGDEAGLAKKMQAAFPNTKIASVKCGLPKNLCEVTAGKTVFYTDPTGRYAVVGSILDLKDRIDLTDRRVRELAALDATSNRLAGGSGETAAPTAGGDNGAAGGQGAAALNAPAGAPATIKIDLPIGNAVVHHRGAPLKISVISDYNCSYCKMLFSAIKDAPDIEVTEYPVQLLRPDSLDKGKLALCAEDRESASATLYFGGEVKARGDCAGALAAVEANTAFARAHGIGGTPTIVRADGRANPGYMPIEQLRAWIKASGRA